MSLRIAFVGQPGSGKTTIAEELAIELAMPYFVAAPQYRSGQRGLSRSAWLRRQVKYVVTWSRPMWLGLMATARSRDAVFRRLGAQIALRTSEIEDRDACVIDEGPRHAAASFLALYDQIDIDRWGPRYARHLPPVDSTIHVKCSPKLAWSRYEQRGGRALRANATDERVERVAERYARAIECLAGEPVIVVDSTSGSPVELARHVAGRLRAIPRLRVA